MTVLQLLPKYKSRLFDCKVPKIVSGKKLAKFCNRCEYKGTAVCPLQASSTLTNIVRLDQFRVAIAASTAATASTSP